ncbi:MULTISPECIES: methyltransferase domain-containing protein [unclassified Streptomyces]|uniref:Methyltransferase domain-containing protein n=1 Tax=Streptomyces sp. NBC_00180 TaxID=2903632 RepID=A0AAU1I9Y1_9ACTN|nr:methyltransferase domain-containing protein [Streptomyces sp. NBC_01017]WSV35015.1 methyltransferase domain-containing protein [Streptomyces sp. NBC_01017]
MGQFNDLRDVAQLYDEKTRGSNSAMNLALASQDGLFFNHNGLHGGEIGDVPKIADDEGRLQLVHAMELELVRVGQEYLGDIGPGAVVLDAGCGAGGGAIVMHKNYGCAVEGVTLSLEQARFGQEAAAAHGVSAHVQFTVGDMGGYAEAAGPFDAVWACESTEHVDDLEKLFRSFRRALKPRGRIVVIAWCAGSGAEADKMKETVDRHYLTNISPPAEYRRAATAAGLTVTNEVDLTAPCVPYWQVRSTSDKATGSEKFMLPAFSSSLLTYNLFVLEA